MPSNFFNTNEPFEPSPTCSIFDFDEDLAVEDYISAINNRFNIEGVEFGSPKYIKTVLNQADFLNKQTNLSVNRDERGYIKSILDSESNNRMFQTCSNFFNKHMEILTSSELSGMEAAKLEGSMRGFLLNILGGLKAPDQRTCNELILLGELFVADGVFNVSSFFLSILEHIDPDTIDLFLYDLYNEHMFVTCLDSNEILNLSVETREYLLVEELNCLLFATESSERAVNLKKDILKLVNYVARDWFVTDDPCYDLKKGLLTSYGSLLERSDVFNNIENDPYTRRRFEGAFNQLKGLAATILGDKLEKNTKIAESLGVLSSLDYWSSTLQNEHGNDISINELGL